MAGPPQKSCPSREHAERVLHLKPHKLCTFEQHAILYCDHDDCVFFNNGLGEEREFDETFKLFGTDCVTDRRPVPAGLVSSSEAGRSLRPI